ncbi:unnamed protein product [Ambrosiozyma monospora]|uniref:Unnamed protein product n=1 Tax=Ambrosiozyma monospora TaxID=43982 RepID=A0ACB5SVE4_AMBMO|nr:unnamed protein product [Ambrosiozyma monospora]
MFMTFQYVDILLEFDDADTDDIDTTTISRVTDKVSNPSENHYSCHPMQDSFQYDVNQVFSLTLESFFHHFDWGLAPTWKQSKQSFLDEIKAYKMIWEHNESCNDPDSLINVPRFLFSGETNKNNMVRIRADNGEGRIVCGPYMVLEKLDDCRILENDS